MTKSRDTKRTALRRFRQRGSHDRAVIDAILDATLMANIGFIHAGSPAILPMAFWRDGNHVYFHGSSKNRMILSLLETPDCCFVTSTIDALVLAKAAIHHSVNYRSVVIYGPAEEIAGKGDKQAALRQFIEIVYPGRWLQIREPSDQELKSVRVMRLAITESSAKTRGGHPTPYEDDRDIPVWTGQIPVELTFGEAVADPNNTTNLNVPEHAYHLRKVWRASSGGGELP